MTAQALVATVAAGAGQLALVLLALLPRPADRVDESAP